MFTADAGGAGLGLAGGRMFAPRGKMLGGSSGINYMAYVRGHPGDFDAWAQAAPRAGVRRGPALLPQERGSARRPDEILIDAEAHGTEGPLGVSVRAPVIAGARAFVDAAVATGIPEGTTTAAMRRPAGLVSLPQTTTLDGKRSSTFHAFLEGEPESRPNLMIVTEAQVTRIVLEGEPGGLRAVTALCQTLPRFSALGACAGNPSEADKG